jgi:hypothetical protein
MKSVPSACMPVAGGAEEKIADVAAGYTWDASGHEFVFLEDSGTVSRFDPAARRITAALKLDGVVGGTNNIGISSDDQWLVYIRMDHRVDDLMLIENFR